MIDRIHGDAANFGFASKPSFATCLPKRDVFMIHVTQLPDGCLTFDQNHSHFSRRKFNERVSILLCHELCVRSGTPDNLTPFPRLQFDIMNMGTQRNIS
jgi:hypothetical protein